MIDLSVSPAPKTHDETRHRPRSGLVGNASRLVLDDATHLWLPLLGWWLFLYSGIALFDPSEDRPWLSPHSTWWLLTALGGPILAGLLVLRHPVTRRAAWRTRPWPRHHMFIAKLAGITLFVWLPAAGLQLALIDTLFGADAPWALHVLELILTPGAWILAGAALAALSPSLAAFLGAFVLSTQGWGLYQQILSKIFEGPDRNYRVVELVIVLIASLLCLALCYLRTSRKQGLMASLALLLLLIPAYPMSWNAGSPLLSVEITNLEVAEPLPEFQAWEDWKRPLCVSFQLLGVSSEVEKGPTVDVEEVRVHGLPAGLAEEITPLSTLATQRTGPEEAMVDRGKFAMAPDELLATHLETPIDVELSLGVRWRRKLLDETELRNGATVQGTTSQGEELSYSVTDARVAQGQYEVSLWFRSGWRLQHLLQPPRVVTRLVIEPVETDLMADRWGSSQHSGAVGPFRAFPFSAQSAVQYGEDLGYEVDPTQDGPPNLTPAPSMTPEDWASQLRLRLVETAGSPGDRIDVTLEGVTLGQLVCR